MIKKIYQKRDMKKIETYDNLDLHKLYCSMLTNYIGNINLILGKKIRSGVNKNKTSYSIDTERIAFIQELVNVSSYGLIDYNTENMMEMNEEEAIVEDEIIE